MINPENITFEKIGCIAVIKLNNPPQNFIKTPAFVSREFLQDIADKEDIKGIVITGMGRHFSAGADLSTVFTMAKNLKNLTEQMQTGKDLLEFISFLPLPVVAAINGVCWGGGLEIALACHVRFASVKSLFAFPEVNNNLMPGLGGIYRMVQKTGTAQSLTILLSGDTFNAEKARELHVVDETTDENVLEYSIQYLNNLVESKPKKVISSIMTAIHNVKKLDLHEALHEETRLFCELALSEGSNRRNSR
ncbi:MAG: enoyl-CoA hydratase/isomerase family protein [Bacteroidota bacterium]